MPWRYSGGCRLEVAPRRGVRSSSVEETILLETILLVGDSLAGKEEVVELLLASVDAGERMLWVAASDAMVEEVGSADVAAADGAGSTATRQTGQTRLV